MTIEEKIQIFDVYMMLERHHYSEEDVNRVYEFFPNKPYKAYQREKVLRIKQFGEQNINKFIELKSQYDKLRPEIQKELEYERRRKILIEQRGIFLLPKYKRKIWNNENIFETTQTRDNSMDNYLEYYNNFNYNPDIMKKEEAQIILDCYEKLEKNILPTDLINQAYAFLPNVTEQTFQRVKVQQIRRFVMFNQDILDEALNEVEIKEVNEDEFDVDNIISRIENELYEDETPEDMEINQSKKPLKARGTIGKPKATKPKTKIIRKK